MGSDRIKLTGISATGYHGVFDFEKRQGQPFRVDAELELDLRAAGGSDALDDTVSYAPLAEMIEQAITGEPYDLIEALAHRIALDILSHDARILTTTVTVHKPQAPLSQDFTNVEVTVHRDRQDLELHLPASQGQPQRASAGLDEEPTHVQGGDRLTGQDGARYVTPTAELGGYDTVPLADFGAEGRIAEGSSAGSADDTGDAESAESPGSTGTAAASSPRAHQGAQLRDPDLPATFPVKAVLALGSNLGESQFTLASAINALHEAHDVDVVRTSPQARTKPVGGPEEQPDFLNQVIEVETSLSPHALLDVAHQVEASHERVRDVRWGPRTLDIDIITYAGATVDSPRLQIPHPRAGERAFVLLPWSWMDPVALLDGVPVRQLAQQAPDAGGVTRLAEEGR